MIPPTIVPTTNTSMINTCVIPTSTGEWYYSTNFGDQGVLTDTDIQNRKDVVTALLDALPEERNVLVRTPAIKQLMTGTSTALGALDYRNYAKNASRIGKHHNSMLLRNSSSQGKEASNTLIKANVVSLKYIYSECIAAYSHIHIKKYVKLLWDF